MNMNDMLFYGGIAVMAADVLFAAAGIIVFRMSGKRLKAHLEAEYGRKKH